MKRKLISVYKPGLPMRSFIMFIGILVAAIHGIALRQIIAESVTGFPYPMMALMILFDALFLWWAIIFVTQSHVTLYEEGIELQQGTSKIFTTWDNVSHIGVKGWGRNQKRGIFLHEKVQPHASGVDKLIFGRKTDFLPIGRYVHLPADWNLFKRNIDHDKLLDKDFGQKLYAVAPHLFDESYDSKPKNRLEDDYSDESQPDWMNDLQSKQKSRK